MMGKMLPVHVFVHACVCVFVHACVSVCVFYVCSMLLASCLHNKMFPGIFILWLQPLYFP